MSSGTVPGLDLDTSARRRYMTPIRGRALLRNLRGPVGITVWIGLPIVLGLVILGPIVAPYATESPVGLPNLSPSAAFPFGTDNAGLDVLSRTLAAARLDIGIGLLAAVIAALLGTGIGLLLGLRDTVAANLSLRVIDTFQALPALIISFTVVALSNGSISVLVLMLALLNAPLFVRSTWTSARAVRQLEFVRAARRSGEPAWRVSLVHIGLNSIDASAAQLSTTVGWSILSVAGISFLGGGVRPPTPEWGAMIAAGSSGLIAGYWWESILPGIVLAFCILWFAAVGEVVRRSTTGAR
jgi:peptide/nickel transport system permease protein